MRIGIDARLCGTHARGIGRYTLELIRHLERMQSDNEYVVFMNNEGASSWNPSKSSWKKIIVDIPVYSFNEQFDMPKEIEKAYVDVMHFPHYNVPLWYSKPYIVTIHDLLLHRHPKSNASTRNRLFFFVKYIVYKRVVHHAIKNARAVIAVSDFTKKEIEHYYKTKKNSIHVIYEGTPSHVSISNGSGKNQLMYIGAVYPHKNLRETISVIHPILKETGGRFVLVGRKDYFYSQLMDWVQQQGYTQIDFKGELTDDEVRQVYTDSKALIFPSVYEGFGLPPLESLLHGCPVLAHDIPAVREVAGKYVTLYKTNKELQDHIRNILQSEKKNVPDSTITEIKSKYSWVDMAKKTESLYTIKDGH